MSTQPNHDLQRLLRERQEYDRSLAPRHLRALARQRLCRFAYRRFRRSDRAIEPLLYAQRLLISADRSPGPPSLLSRFAHRAVAGAFGRQGWAHRLIDRKDTVDPPQWITKHGQLEFHPLKHGGIVLKAPRLEHQHVVEKGVLLLRHNAMCRLVRDYLDVPRLLADYTLVLEPGWSALAGRDLLYFARFADSPVIVMATDHGDYQFLHAIGTNLVPVSFGSSDWTDPDLFHPLPDQTKRYDVIMVARWARFKRHHSLFQAVRDMADRSFKVALAGIPEPQYRRELDTLLSHYNVNEQVDVFGRLPQDELNRLLNQSKVNVLLSLQEGGNKTLFEGMFAGVPALGLKNNIGMNKTYFTAQSGKLIDERDLSSELQWFSQHWSDFDPRRWALAHIAADKTTVKLNAILKAEAAKRAEPWTCDIVAKCNRPEVQYYPDATVGEGLATLKQVLLDFARSPEARQIIEYAATASAAAPPGRSIPS